MARKRVGWVDSAFTGCNNCLEGGCSLGIQAKILASVFDLA
jgi:hypothetical protein